MELSQVPFHEEEFVTAASLNELQEQAQVFSGFEPETLPGSAIRLNDEGFVTVGGDHLAITRTGFAGLCSALRLPNPFVKRIPFDLLQTNVDRLGKTQDELVVFRSPMNNHISNICRPRQADAALPIVEVVTAILDSGALNGVGFEVSEHGVVADIAIGDLPKNDHPAVGDVTQFGWQLQLSECGAYMPAGRFWAMVLSCANGMVAPRNFGSIKARPKGKTESRIRGFVARLQAEQARLGGFVQSYNFLADHPEMIPDNLDVSRVWTGVKRVMVEPELADNILGISEDQRTELRSLAKAQRASMNAVGLESFDDDEPRDYTKPVIKESWWKLINRITAAANEMKGGERRKLQELGGKTVHTATKSLAFDIA